MAGCEANPTLCMGAGEVVLMVEHVLSLHGLVMYSHVANCAGYLISHVGVLSTALSQLIPGCPFSVSSGGYFGSGPGRLSTLKVLGGGELINTFQNTLIWISFITISKCCCDS